MVEGSLGADAQYATGPTHSSCGMKSRESGTAFVCRHDPRDDVGPGLLRVPEPVGPGPRRQDGAQCSVARGGIVASPLVAEAHTDAPQPGYLRRFVHAIAVFGEHMWSIRLLELGCLAALGLVCARLATPMGQAVPLGVRGVGVLAAAVAYVGFFDFWNTAQCEI